MHSYYPRPGTYTYPAYRIHVQIIVSGKILSLLHSDAPRSATAGSFVPAIANRYPNKHLTHSRVVEKMSSRMLLMLLGKGSSG